MQNNNVEESIKRERWGLLRELDAFLDKPLIALSFAWLMLLILDFNEGLTPSLTIALNIIWALFILDFGLELWIAPNKAAYLRNNWVTAVSILLPAFRVLRVFRALRILRLARFGRSINLVRLLTSVRRGMRAMNRTLGKRGFGYVVILTTLIIFAGAAGMAHFEDEASVRQAGCGGSRGLRGYGDALWWTAMIMTTMGSEYWPKTAEGRILGWLLSLYAFTVFGYITATLASHFVQTDQTSGGKTDSEE